MYKYKFEKIELSKWSSKPKEEYQDVINKYANEGWRLVQIFAPGIAAYGSAAYYEIIFERPLQS
ncbi:DUF4177 domain-containing protein [Bacillus sp. 03113]|uniref:DUF4177 domain-containing protein n=1 Tax=Bacillus sp. 03113 TaxID=2578211 RepID=UPI001144D989|nr:DUF4177 domain-containing protein [Bacillus sp. 03113]